VPLSRQTVRHEQRHRPGLRARRQRCEGILNDLIVLVQVEVWQCWLQERDEIYKPLVAICISLDVLVRHGPQDGEPVTTVEPPNGDIGRATLELRDVLAREACLSQVQIEVVVVAARARGVGARHARCPSV